MSRLAPILIVFCLSSPLLGAIPWPFVPFDSAQPIGNSYGEYQDYGSGAYLHPGMDIMHPAGAAVYAVKAGWVKAVLTTGAEFHWRVAVADVAGADSSDGWLYAHLEEQSIAVAPGQHVDSGQYLGNLVEWPIADFNHCHFVKIRNAGLFWEANWLFVGNPLDELVNVDDFDPPYFLEDVPAAPFRFCVDNTDIYFDIGAPVSGNVDIIAHAHDKVGHPTWVLTPCAMGYEIYSDSVSLGPYESFVFTGRLLWNQVPHIIFKNSGPCNSAADYDQRQYYEIITNHDADSLITPMDVSGRWATGVIPNDTYTVKVWAKDRYGNIAWDSMEVATANYYGISGTVAFSDNNPCTDGAVVTIPYTSALDSVSANGDFSLPAQPAGRYAVVVSRSGYQTSSEVYEVFSNLQLSFVLDPDPYVDGDVDHSSAVDVSDVVYIISHIFAGGPCPVPWAAGVHIDPSPELDISDAIYLIEYIFGGGPPPGGH